MNSGSPRSATAPLPVKLADLYAFCAVVDHGSISAAARVLGEAKGSVSRRVSRLESVAGAALIARSGGRATPTPEGMAYRRRVGEAIELLGAAHDELQGQAETPSGHLRITTLPGMGAALLAEPLGRFVERFPAITVEVLSTERVLSFREDGIDFAIRAALGPLPDSGHIAVPLVEMGLCMAASPAYLAHHGTPRNPTELAGHRLLVPPARGGGMRMRVQPRGRPDLAEDVDLRGHLLCHDSVLLREAARAGGGIAVILPVPLDAEDELVPVLPDWELSTRGRLVLLRPAGPTSPKARAFVDHMKAEFRINRVAK